MSDTIKTKIVGVTFKNEDGTSRQELLSELSEGDTLSLKDTFSDKYPEAIGVFNSYGEQLGNLKKDLALKLREMDGDFECFDVKVLEITGGDDRSFGCNIEITLDDFFTCHVTIMKTSGLRIKPPLLKTPNSVSPSLINALSLKEESDSISVYTENGEYLGVLPPFACEQIKKWNQSLIPQSSSLFDTRTDADGDLHLRVLLDLVPNAPVTPKKAAPVQEPEPPAAPEPPIPNAPAATTDSTPSRNGGKWILGLIIILLIVAYFFMK